MKCQTLLALFVAVFLSACSIQQTVEKAEIPKDNVLCIVENSNVREGFLKEFRSNLQSRNIPYQVVASGVVPESCIWTATYVANWTWDLALYMSYAEIKIFNQGQLDGQAIYDSRKGGANMDKFIDAETKINELLNELLQLKTGSLFSHIYG
jgi:hypothetical protein